MVTGSARDQRRRLWLGLAVWMVLAFGVRCLSVPALSSGRLRMVSADDYGHLRRMLMTAREWPRVPVADAFLDHPEGAVWIWPPLFDLVGATAVRARHGPDATVEEAIRVVAWIPPLLGALTLLPLFLLARRVFGAGAAWASAAVYTFQPGAAAWSVYGHVDQHVGEILAFLITLASTATLVASPPVEPEGDAGRQPPLAATSDRSGGRASAYGSWTRIAGLGLALAAAALTWQGAIFIVAILGAVALLAARERAIGAAMLLAAAVAGLVALGNPSPVTYVSFGWFQPMVIAVAGAVVWLWGGSRRERLAALLVGAASVAFWLPVREVAQHFGFISTTGAAVDGDAPLPTSWLEVIAESRPLWADPLSRTLGDLTIGLLLVPIALLLWGRQALRPPRSPLLWVPLTATVVVLAMAVSQKRYVYYLAPLVAIAAGDLVSRWSRRSRAPLAVATLALALLLAPSWRRFLDLVDTGPAVGLDVLSTLERLAAHDPPPIDPLVAARGPAGEIEGILAPWSLGHFVTLFAQRPAVSDNFGYGFLRQADVYTAPAADDARVATLLRDWRCRYVVTGDLRPVLPSYARGAGRNLPVEQMWSERVHRSTNDRPLPYLKLVLTSETGLPDGGRIVPLLKVFAVIGPTEDAAARDAGESEDE